MFRRILCGCLAAIFLSVAFTAWPYLLIGFGLNPEATSAAGLWAPLLALFCVGMANGARAKARESHRAWLTGFIPSTAMVALWFIVWCYLTGRYSPSAWFHEGFAKLSAHHLLEWLLALGFGVAGSTFGAFAPSKTWPLVAAAISASLAFLAGTTVLSSLLWNASRDSAYGMTMLQEPSDDAGTTLRLFTFDFTANPGLKLRLYDADMDDAVHYDDANSSYMGNGIDLVAERIDRMSRVQGRQLLCAFNSGFFGTKDARIAIHEAPVVIDSAPHYNVDLIRPKNQAWVLGANSRERVQQGTPRLTLQPEIPWQDLGNYETVLAGVRPLRVSGTSIPLEPGIGSTRLRCSRTSLGWTSNGDKLCVLIVRDPDTEGSSNLQRHAGKAQTGGWDVREVQAFWETQGIPNAVLLDGGESTQAVYRDANDSLVFLRGGYHAGIPIGHIGNHPLVAFPAMLPRLQNSRGVLNYLYIDMPIPKNTGL